VERLPCSRVRVAAVTQANHVSTVRPGRTASLTHACRRTKSDNAPSNNLSSPASLFPKRTVDILFCLPLNLSMTSASPTRRVLGALDVNTSTPRSVAPSPTARVGSPEKPQKMSEGISLQAFEHSMREAVHKEGCVNVGKRSFSPVTTVSTSSSKRQKTGTGNEKGYGVAFHTQRNTSIFGLAEAISESEHVEVHVQSFISEVGSKHSTLLPPSSFYLSSGSTRDK
jgi:hypothetical protein